LRRFGLPDYDELEVCNYSKATSSSSGLWSRRILSACQAQGTSPATASYSFSSTQIEVRNANQQSVAYQINAQHTGFAQGPLKLPLKQLWSVDLGSGVGYPIIANGIVVVTADGKLVALDEKTGKKLWTQGSPSGYNWIGPAYDNGTVFVDPEVSFGTINTGMFAFDERTGHKLWVSPSPGQYGFEGPPTAASGIVYTAAAGRSATIYAYDESTGALKWSDTVDSGDTSPAVTSTAVFASYYGPQTYKFDPITGKQKWHFKGPNTGGGGTSPVLYDGLLFVGGSIETYGYNGLILKAGTGKAVGRFNASFSPAFASHVGFFVYYTTLEAHSVPKMNKVWSVTLANSETYVTPPLVVGDVVYIETSANSLIGYDAKNGKQIVSIDLASSGEYRNVSGALGFGDDELVVPSASYLTAFKGS
jgi:outer membrane protein assembly factor BamB